MEIKVREPADLTGPIGEIEVSAEMDFSNDDLGICWIKNNEAITSGSERNVRRIFREKRRTIVLPSKQEELIDYLVEMIRSARDGICMSSFLIQNSRVTDALLEAAKSGVNVVLLTARENELKASEEELEGFNQEVIKQHKALLDSFAGKVLVRTSPDFHAKYLIIDPHSETSSGVMMTCNATVDAMTGKNTEIAVSLTSEEISSFFFQFLRGFWEMAGHELLSEKGELKGVKKSQDIGIKFGTVTSPATYNNEKTPSESKLNTLRETVLEMIKKAENNLILTAWGFDKDYAIIKALEDARKRNVDVAIYTKPNSRNTESLVSLVSSGARVFGYPRFHAKCVLADGREGLLTTANFGRLGLETGFEVSTILDTTETQLMGEILAYWSDLCEWELKPELLIKEAPKQVKHYDAERRELTDLEIIPEKIQPLPAHTLSSCEEAIGFLIPEDKIKEPSGDPSKKYKKVKIVQNVLPAILPENAVEEKEQKTPFPIYNRKKKNRDSRYVVVKTWEDVRKVKESAKDLKAKIVIKKVNN